MILRKNSMLQSLRVIPFIPMSIAITGDSDHSSPEDFRISNQLVSKHLNVELGVKIFRPTLIISIGFSIMQQNIVK